MSRPKLPPARRRRHLLTIPLTLDELDAVRAYAEEHGMTMSELVRDLLAGALATSAPR